MTRLLDLPWGVGEPGQLSWGSRGCRGGLSQRCPRCCIRQRVSSTALTTRHAAGAPKASRTYRDTAAFLTPGSRLPSRGSTHTPAAWPRPLPGTWTHSQATRDVKHLRLHPHHQKEGRPLMSDPEKRRKSTRRRRAEKEGRDREERQLISQEGNFQG